SFAGNLTYPSAGALREAASSVPEDRLLVETDSPFLSPVPHRGQPNAPANARLTAARLAEVRGADPAALEAVLDANAAALFGWGAAVIPGRDGERQGFRDEALRVDVALDASGAAAYQGSRPASLYVERVGPVGAPTVYFLHGGPGYNAASFREIAGGELEELDVVYADQRGAGRSTGEGGSDVALLAADVFAVMDALGIARATLLAHGFGALVALRAARTAPERVERLVLV